MARLGRSYPSRIWVGRMSTAAAPPTPVTFDAVGPSSAGQGQTGGASPLTWSHTCSGSDRLLIVGVVLASSNDAAISTTVTYNGVSMASVAGEVHSNALTAGYAEMFQLVAPATGANTVSVTITGATVEGLECGSVSFNGVDQTTPIAHQATATGLGTPATVAVGSATNNMVVDLVACGGTISASTQTSRWLLNRNAATAAGNGAQATAPGAASVTMSRTTAASESWAIIAADLAVSVGVAGQTISPTGIASGQTVGDSDVVPGAATVTTQAVPSRELVGVAQVSQQIQATGIPGAEQFGQTAAGQAIAATGIKTEEGAGTHTATPGAVTIAATSIASAERAGAVTTATVSTTVATGISSAGAVGQAAVSQAIAVVGMPSAERHGTAVATTVAGITINATGIPSAERVSTQDSPDIFSEGYGPFVITLAVTPSGVPTGEQVGNLPVTIVGPTQTITATGIPSAQTLGTALTGQAIAPVGIGSGQQAGNLTVTPGAVTLPQTGISSAEAFGNAFTAIAAPQVVTAVGIATAQAFGITQVAQSVSVAGIRSSERLGNAVATPGVVSITGTGIPSQQIFGVLILNREGIPDAILASTNLTGSLVDVQDDPLSPDANYLTAIDPTLATDLRVSFPTPFLQPSAVGGPKTFRVYVRRTTTPGSPDPIIVIDLWESGVFKSQLASVTVTSTSGQLVQGTMNPADLTDPSGAGVELRVRGVPV